MRVCLLLNEPGIRNYYHNALEQVLSRTEADITLAIVNRDHSPAAESLGKAIGEGVISTASYVRSKLTTIPEYLRYTPIDDAEVLRDTTVLRTSPIPCEDRLGHKLPTDVVDEIADRSDVVLRHGFGILQGCVLSEPKYGVLSYHHGDIRRYRGAAQGFWNFIYSESTAGVTLQRLTPELDAGEIIAYREINIEDCYTWQEVRRRLFEASIPMLADGIENVQNPDYEPTEPDSLGEMYTSADRWKPKMLTRYLCKNNVGRLKRWYAETG